MQLLPAHVAMIDILGVATSCTIGSLKEVLDTYKWQIEFIESLNIIFQ